MCSKTSLKATQSKTFLEEIILKRVWDVFIPIFPKEVLFTVSLITKEINCFMSYMLTLLIKKCIDDKINTNTNPSNSANS